MATDVIQQIKNGNRCNSTNKEWPFFDANLIAPSFIPVESTLASARRVNYSL
jgi:hypothetical protein